ncbi:alpha-1,2-fucosyltransferase [Lactococcus garvieae]|uniref:alpha-1,2-fucosyltransferase n=1 Tax=Lactococcus garvieae TaxID=1363 RepID=UPI0018D9F435|nr:alpha-1,2-fucosyltransferase [Lactococcus garvieae]QPS70943.1 alpha-1,2-fucosyltransferase [Lactococcus garvieae]
MKKIILNASGRLGNQLFQYGFAKKVQNNLGGKILINFNDIEAKDKEFPNQNWEDSLKGFRVEYEKISLPKKEFIISFFSVKQKLLILIHFILVRTIFKAENFKTYENLNTLSKKYANFLYRNALYMFPILSGAYAPSTKDEAFLNGKFEVAHYFEEVSDELKAEIVPKAPPLEQNIPFLNIIGSSQSVCITIRRGDYLSDKNSTNFFHCDEKYFDKGIKIIKSKVKNPVFFFFSDDLDYAREFAQAYLSKNDKYYIELPGNPIWEKLRIMSACKHFIISNSTFSWWAQFLGKNPDKIVIGPKTWFPPKSEYNGDALLQDTWIKI